MTISHQALSNGWKIILLGLLAIGSAFPSSAQFTPTNPVVVAVMADTNGNIVAPTNLKMPSGFPATNNLDYAGFGADNVGYIGESNPPDKAFLMYSGTGYVHEYVARIVTNYLSVAAAQASSNAVTLYPGQLLRYSDEDVYSLQQTIYGTNFVPFTTNSFPWPGASIGYWMTFVEKGPTGSAGRPGSDGSDGFGNMLIGPWDSGKEYLYDTNALHFVEYDQQWYRILQSNTNKPPDIHPTFWTVSVARGMSGAISGSTNLLYRGDWNAGFSYASNDVVSYEGNQFITWTNTPLVGAAPKLDGNGVGINSSNWNVHVGRGAKGATGATGADGAVTMWSNIVNYAILFDTNAVFINAPSSSNDAPFYVGSSGATNFYQWKTAILGVSLQSGSSNSVLTNGARIVIVTVNSGGGTVTNAYSENDWLTASVVSGQVVIGSTSTPLFAEADLGAQLANATSLVGRAVSTNAPNDGAAMVWSATQGAWVPSDAPPASSTGSVSSVNGGVGLVTVQGGPGAKVETAGTTNPVITVSDDNSIAPVLVSTNVSGVWVIDLSAGANQRYIMSGAVTAIVFSVANTSNVTKADVQFYSASYTLPSPWITESGSTNIVWAKGYAPAQSTNAFNVMGVRFHSNKVHAVYLGTE